MNIIKTFTAEVLYASSCQLGENPIWNSLRGSICWIDIEQMKLLEYSIKEKKLNQWQFKQHIGMIVLDEYNNLILGLQNELISFDMNSAKITWLSDFEKELPCNRPNDGRCDSMGRLWVGTMDVQAKEGLGSLYCVSNNAFSKRLSNLTIANGKVWSPDTKILYFTDSFTRRIDAYYFDIKSGSIEYFRTVICVPDYLGLPDGMTIDEEGMLWVAHWGGYCVCRWNPEDGSLLTKIELPVPHVTSCEFGGDDLDMLFITTAKTGLSIKDQLKYPLSGHLFTVNTGIKGIAENLYKHK
jgi:sugar lactone lactonase YvrE